MVSTSEVVARLRKKPLSDVGEEEKDHDEQELQSPSQGSACMVWGLRVEGSLRARQKRRGSGQSAQLFCIRFHTIILPIGTRSLAR